MKRLLSLVLSFSLIAGLAPRAQAFQLLEMGISGAADGIAAFNAQAIVPRALEFDARVLPAFQIRRAASILLIATLASVPYVVLSQTKPPDDLDRLAAQATKNSKNSNTKPAPVTPRRQSPTPAPSALNAGTKALSEALQKYQTLEDQLFSRFDQKVLINEDLRSRPKTYRTFFDLLVRSYLDTPTASPRPPEWSDLLKAYQDIVSRKANVEELLKPTKEPPISPSDKAKPQQKKKTPPAASPLPNEKSAAETALNLSSSILQGSRVVIGGPATVLLKGQAILFTGTAHADGSVTFDQFTAYVEATPGVSDGASNAWSLVLARLPKTFNVFTGEASAEALPSSGKTVDPRVGRTVRTFSSSAEAKTHAEDPNQFDIQKEAQSFQVPALANATADPSSPIIASLTRTQSATTLLPWYDLKSPDQFAQAWTEQYVSLKAALPSNPGTLDRHIYLTSRVLTVLALATGFTFKDAEEYRRALREEAFGIAWALINSPDLNSGNTGLKLDALMAEGMKDPAAFRNKVALERAGSDLANAEQLILREIKTEPTASPVPTPTPAPAPSVPAKKSSKAKVKTSKSQNQSSRPPQAPATVSASGQSTPPAAISPDAQAQAAAPKKELLIRTAPPPAGPSPSQTILLEHGGSNLLSNNPQTVAAFNDMAPWFRGDTVSSRHADALDWLTKDLQFRNVTLLTEAQNHLRIMAGFIKVMANYLNMQPHSITAFFPRDASRAALDLEKDFPESKYPGMTQKILDELNKLSEDTSPLKTIKGNPLETDPYKPVADAAGKVVRDHLTSSGSMHSDSFFKEAVSILDALFRIHWVTDVETFIARRELTPILWPSFGTPLRWNDRLEQAA